MTGSICIGTRTVGESERCYVVAEAGSNHNSSLDTALELVDAAAESGAEAVKFQFFRASHMYPTNCGVVPTPDGPEDFYRLLERLEVPESWIGVLADRASSRSIDLLFSVFDPGGVDVIGKSGTRALKIASFEITHLPLLRTAASTGLPLLLSSGMSTMEEIGEALETIREAGGRQVLLLHCVSSYPCVPDECNLAAITVMQSALGIPIGWSDHTIDPVAAPIVARMLGAAAIEKHFTLDRAMSGPDHAFSLLPDELAEMVRTVRDIEDVEEHDRHAVVSDLLGEAVVSSLIGSSEKKVTPGEALLAACDRRSIHATRAIEAGDTLSEFNIAILRGERNLSAGLHPRVFDRVLGSVASRRIEPGAGVAWEDLIRVDSASP